MRLICLVLIGFGVPVSLACKSSGLDNNSETGSSTETGPDSGDTDTGPEISAEWARPFNTVTLAGTHNSYVEDIGTVESQLNLGVRCLEFDLHDNDFKEFGDYRIGHDSPGDEVASSANGVGVLLKDWLGLVQSWSQAHSDHAPITMVLDLKDNLTDNQSAEDGNLGALNETIRSIFGRKIWSPQDVSGDWPQIHDLRGRVLVQLSGDWLNRARYLRDPGQHPAVAINDKGQVIEVHDSGTGNLWYWSGQMATSGTVSWLHHGLVGTGQDASIALDKDGWIVEAHKSENKDQLWAHLGRFNDDYTVTWGASKKFDSDGVHPSLNWNSDDTLTEIHALPDGGRKAWTVDVDRGAFTLNFRDQVSTSTPRFETSEAQSSAGSIVVSAGADPQGAGDDTLMYSSGAAVDARIRYDQVAFVDVQSGDLGELLKGGSTIFNVNSGGLSSAQARLKQGWLARIYNFSETDVDLSKLQPTCPATDAPKSSWYRDYLEDVSALE